MSALQEKITHFETLQKEIIEANANLEKKMEQYRAELKATFGITDGEKMNVLDMIKAISKVKELA